MTELKTGQDVIVEAENLLDGQAFLASVERMGKSEDTVLVRTESRPGLPSRTHVHVNQVVTLTEVFDAVREDL